MQVAEKPESANPIRIGEYAKPHADLREWIERVDRMGELLRVSGAEWHLEMGAIAEMVYADQPQNPPAILFENVPGYSKEFRVLSGMTNSPKRLALTLGLPTPKHPLDVVRAYRDRMKKHQMIPNVFVKSGPILENVDRDDAVDLYKFPTPHLHELDGGRYIGTGYLVIMRDPDSEWVNCGTYRGQIHDKNTLGLWMSPGKHGRQIREKYFKQGKPCPVVISCGHRGVPFDTVKSELFGLPMPASAEIVLEGEILPDDLRQEGPFGEWTGYYASSVRPDNVVRIKRVYHRNSPIMTMARPGRAPSDYSLSKCVMKAAMIWDQVEKAGLSGVQGVWCHEAGGGRLFNIISIKQAYAGHAKQAGLLAAGCHAGNYIGRWVIVVDEDIDPTNNMDILWAMATRCYVAEDVDFIRRAWSGPLDPRKAKAANFNSRALVVACKPFETMADFPPTVGSSPELHAKIAKKWGHLLKNR